MENLSKKDIKEIFIESLEPFAQSIQKDFGKVNKRLNLIESEISGVREELKSEISGVREELKSEIYEVKEDVKWLKENFHPFMTKLDEFISLYQKHEQELTIMSEQLRRLEERVVKLELNK